jgi:hypothetical protein
MKWCCTHHNKLGCLVARLRAKPPRKCASIPGRSKWLLPSTKNPYRLCDPIRHYPTTVVVSSLVVKVAEAWSRRLTSIWCRRWEKNGKGEGKVFPVCAMKACKGRTGLPPIILMLGTRWRSMVSFTSRPLCSIPFCLRRSLPAQYGDKQASHPAHAFMTSCLIKHRGYGRFNFSGRTLLREVQGLRTADWMFVTYRNLW